MKPQSPQKIHIKKIKTTQVVVAADPGGGCRTLNVL